MPIGRKQRTSNDAWLQAIANICETVPQKHIDELAAKTAAEIKKAVKGQKAAYAWSGGKDSIVLGRICEAAGVKDSMIGVCNLEYPAFMSWVNEHKPDGCKIVNTGQDLKWLANHPDMLFPRDSGKASRWFAIVQHAAQRRYFHDRGLDILILGRRRADGNYVGHKTNVYVDGKGVKKYSPLATWSHEDILAYLYYHKLPLPPIYGWEKGYLCGTHPWPARQWTEDEQSGWAEIYQIDRSIVEGAAKVIKSAAVFLEGVEK